MSRLKEKGGLLSTVLADDVYYRKIDESFGCLRQSLSWQCHMVPTPPWGKPFLKVTLAMKRFDFPYDFKKKKRLQFSADCKGQIKP